MLSTRSLPDGRTYRGSSLPSLYLQAKGSEYSFATGRRVSERNSPYKRRDVGVRNSSSGPCVLDPEIEQNCELLTRHFFATAKVIHSWLRGSSRKLSSPPVNNFGRTISASGLPALLTPGARPVLDSAGKPDALHTLRAEISQAASNLDRCSTGGVGRSADLQSLGASR
jgi:hypothetical protein